MALTILKAEEKISAKKASKNAAKKIGEMANKKNDVSALKQKQLNSLKQGLKEAILIERGELEGNAISTLWDE